jgi:5S rRNA maturation endonuclease (ribonuclease M5)
MSESIRGLLASGLLAVTKDWATIKKKEDRERRKSESARERYWRGYKLRVTVKDAAYQIMAAAYEETGGAGRWPANARQIMYKARGRILERTGQTSLNDVYFTQVLLPNYQREHPAETANWDVVYDARGHLLEPHTGVQIGVGTLEVRKYIGNWYGEIPGLNIDIEVPKLSRRFPTYGPANRYNSVLYIEKEGFLPLLEKATFARRYDMAIMSSKGMGTVAARTLIEKLSSKATIFVLHDFDKSGFSIAGTLSRDTRRYEFKTAMKIVDLGLRLADVEEWNLESEPVQYKSDPTSNLKQNGATAKEIAFLYDGYRGGYHRGKRVELNALDSDQFVKWLDSKLTQHGAKKVIPDKETLDQAYRRAAAVLRYQQIIETAGKEVLAYAKDLAVPRSLGAKVAKKLAETKGAMPWDMALSFLVGDGS